MARMRDRTASRNYSPERDEFRREHERHRNWGLQQRHAERLRRLRGSRPAGAMGSRQDRPAGASGTSGPSRQRSRAAEVRRPQRGTCPTPGRTSPASRNQKPLDAPARCDRKPPTTSTSCNPKPSATNTNRNPGPPTATNTSRNPGPPTATTASRNPESPAIAASLTPGGGADTRSPSRTPVHSARIRRLTRPVADPPAPVRPSALFEHRYEPSGKPSYGACRKAQLHAGMPSGKCGWKSAPANPSFRGTESTTAMSTLSSSIPTGSDRSVSDNDPFPAACAFRSAKPGADNGGPETRRTRPQGLGASKPRAPRTRQSCYRIEKTPCGSKTPRSRCTSAVLPR
jgi:hypothetical protein